MAQLKKKNLYSIADFLANVWMPMEVWSENFSWQLLAGGAIPQALTKSAISETTIHYVPGVGFLFWGIDFLATQLKVYTSPVMTGPYNAQPVFDIPAPWNNTPSVFCYAPKLHLELSDIANRRLFLTFMSNAQNVADLTTDLQVYKPVGVWIDVKWTIKDSCIICFILFYSFYNPWKAFFTPLRTCSAVLIPQKVNWLS